ncbi:hypothetical protein R69888_02230 [Paraburkholderia haematera]|uniref:Major facilitator superfamily (MFS) profile domain-containing protein n=1 Tax=Paraburkholderia haematera TaxID=2793077 RepID=A0ABM8R628_9BURK|nr:MFS transporter [Paraburkholderia haematera]CAE6734669.1 hypothetical protein R69888_02230 [Paraburkholderia haematera]
MASGEVIDIKAFIDERPISLYQWLLVALCFLVVTADGMDVAIMGFVAPAIIHDWGISRPAFGLVMSAGWLPTLMKDAGLTVTTAANVTAMFQIGGTIGAILVGWMMDKVRPAPVISAAYLGGALCVLALAWIGALSSSLVLLVFAAGFCMSGAQTGLNAFAPGRYPTVARATGVSWMLGMGRFGSIFGSAIGGALLGLGWQFGAILAMLAVPATLAALAILVAQRARAGEPTAQPNAAH